MSKLKDPLYTISSKDVGDDPKILSFKDLKRTPGIYMITNKVTKKYYVGMSKNLFTRLNNYLYLARLIDKSSSRIHKAILKYGYSNFSVTILKFSPSFQHADLKKLEDYYIKILKPQYNIAISSFRADLQLENDLTLTNVNKFLLPTRIKNLLDKSLDPKLLD